MKENKQKKQSKEIQRMEIVRILDSIRHDLLDCEAEKHEAEIEFLKGLISEDE